MKLQKTLHADDDHVEIRSLVRRSALTIVETPRCVSQHTSERVLGIPPRTYLETVREYARAGGEVSVIGKLRLVDVERFARWLATRSRTSASTTPSSSTSAVDALAAELGLVEVRS